jgi:2-polyprenyl-3-methyl-5-hydroxy-6-metoxy-1,4-benzoquinol methylase
MTSVATPSPDNETSSAHRQWPRSGSWLYKLFDLFRRRTEPDRLVWTRELTDRFWNGFSKTRLVELSFSRLGGKALIASIAHLLPEDGRILDFGAGDGDLAELMCQRGLHVAVYEPSSERSRHLRDKLTRYPGFLGAVKAWSHEQFDVVLLVEVIEHILDEQLDETLKLLAHFTRSGGILLVTTPNNEDLDLNMAYCPVSNMLFHRWQHVRSFTQESLSALIGEYGFEEVATHQIEFRDDLFVPYDKIWGTPTAKLPPHVVDLRANRARWTGAGSNLLYIGRKSVSSAPV